LPFRSKQQGTETVHTTDQELLNIAVTAKVSLAREAWRVVWRALSAAVPESWRMLRAGWRLIGRVTRALGRPFARHAWLLWLMWFLCAGLIATGLYYLPPWAQGWSLWTWSLQRPESWADYLAPDHLALILLGPPALLSLVWLAFIVVTLLGGAVLGALRGVWKSFFR
jgi:hypothetical protein